MSQTRQLLYRKHNSPHKTYIYVTGSLICWTCVHFIQSFISVNLHMCKHRGIPSILEVKTHLECTYITVKAVFAILQRAHALKHYKGLLF